MAAGLTVRTTLSKAFGRGHDQALLLPIGVPIAALGVPVQQAGDVKEATNWRSGQAEGGILRMKIYPSIDMCGVLYF